MSRCRNVPRRAAVRAAAAVEAAPLGPCGRPRSRRRRPRIAERGPPSRAGRGGTADGVSAVSTICARARRP
ncbi:MAG TPA: hypothetical protein VFM93_05345 [Candidatus Limnocylindria bacterium]|nr:hypothetical protein [Candidatus Limnocylindria bacterium]